MVEIERVRIQMETIDQIKERPIPFSGGMVRAILEGRKTQTRRVIKPQPTRYDTPTGIMWGHEKLSGLFADHVFEYCMNQMVSCPHGAPGDHLWVREEWRPFTWSEDGKWGDIEYRADEYIRTVDAPEGVVVPFSKMYPSSMPVDRWRSGRYMYKWMSRIKLEVTSVRAERVQDIHGEDALEEGVDYEWHGMPVGAVESFRKLWDTINAKRGYEWDVNPWVWVVGFRQLIPNLTSNERH